MIMPKNVELGYTIFTYLTGDEGFRRREFFSLTLEARNRVHFTRKVAYYGIRRPANQDSMYLLFFSDLFQMVHGAMEEGDQSLAISQRSIPKLELSLDLVWVDKRQR